MIYLALYLGSCIGIYIGAALYNKEHTFAGASVADVLRGLAGALVWPILIPIMWSQREQHTDK